ncbi:hypothetical protein KKH39_01510 [Patescibacteria group bacterium]|nr:hypothetical protein [Patescibacteria group bacterium]
MNEHFENPSSPEKIDYKALLKLRKVDIDREQRTWVFSVTENFTIFITSKFHKGLSDNYGVDPDSTLTEGYIKFDEQGNIEKINFKNPVYQPAPAFKTNNIDLFKLQRAVEEMIMEDI